MPSRRAEAPASVPDCETIEDLLGVRNRFDARTRKTRTLAELTDDERSKTNLVAFGTRQERIEGDPFAVIPSWAGNVGHPRDVRMLLVMQPIFQELLDYAKKDGSTMEQIVKLLGAVPSTGVKELAQKFSTDGEYLILLDDTETATVRFTMGPHSVRLMQAKDLVKDEGGSYLASLQASKRNKASEDSIDDLFGSDTISVDSQQYIAAEIMEESVQAMPTKDSAMQKYLEHLRVSAQERYWMVMSSDERLNLSQKMRKPKESVVAHLKKIQENWPPTWNNGRRDPDLFRNYVRDSLAADKVWPLVDEDIFVVTDNNRQVVFACIQEAVQMLFGQGLADLLARCIDMWSFYTPLPAPESKRHAVDSHIRKIHPELDMEKATVEGLLKAKMTMSHQGCWATSGHPDGRFIVRTRDSRCSRTLDQDYSEQLAPDFHKSVFGKASDTIEFMVKLLDPEYLEDCQKIFEHLPENSKVRTSSTRDFLSLFALGINGHTQRHRDESDIKGGLAGLVTLGTYTGGDLALPQLGMKVKYTSGTCAILRGDSLEHLVTDWSGTRYFIVGTNHNSCKRYSYRKMGLEPPLPPLQLKPAKRAREDDAGLDEVVVEEDITATTCVNPWDDDQDQDVWLSNRELHGPGALKD